MKSVLLIANVDLQKDFVDLQKKIAKCDGIIAIEFKQKIKSIVIVYDELHISLDEIHDTLSEFGYIVI